MPVKEKFAKEFKKVTGLSLKSKIEIPNSDVFDFFDKIKLLNSKYGTYFESPLYIEGSNGKSYICYKASGHRKKLVSP